MKSLKNKKCVVCGKTATTWFPREEIGKYGETVVVDRPHCAGCCDQAVLEVIEREDEEEDDVLLGGYGDDGLDSLV